MKKSKILLLSSLLVLSGCNNAESIDYYQVNKTSGNDDFTYKGNYIEPELKVDGIASEEQWNNVTNYLSFATNNKATVKLYRGETALYAFFNVVDPDLQVVGNNDGDDVNKGDSIEIYFDFKNDGSKKPASDDLQVNIGVHGRTRIFIGSNGEWGSWNGLLDYEVSYTGTINSSVESVDNDTGYNVEIMIPYAQVGITKESTIGLAVGCVSRGTDSTSTALDYTWEGINYNGEFVDPQKPISYIVYQGDNFYSKGEVPKDDINLSGYVYAQDKSIVSNATLTIGDKVVTTDSNGHYQFIAINPNVDQVVTLSKEGFDNKEITLTDNFLRDGDDLQVNKDFVLVDKNKNFNTTITGVVKNPADGIVNNATIKFNNDSVLTDNEGKFSYNLLVNDDVTYSVSKEGYSTSKYTIDIIDLIGNESIDLGDVAVYSPTSSFVFGGARTTEEVKCNVYRGFKGVNFIFETKHDLVGGDKVELFIDSKETTPSRNQSDYRIDFNGNGDISIVNFGNGTNTAVSKSGITSNTYLLGTSYYIEAFIPYSFLEINSADVFGFSCGSYKAYTNDWDGMSFVQDGFQDYVAPEIPQYYVRVGLDNGLYRSLSNSVVPMVIYGSVSDENGILYNAKVNDNELLENGTYRIYVIDVSSIEIIYSCVGYKSQVVSINLLEQTEQRIKKDIVLAKSVGSVSGTITIKGTTESLSGVKIYLQGKEQEAIYSDSNGKYTIYCPTTENAVIVFEIEGYKSITKTISKTALTNSGETNTPYAYNPKMEESE